MQENLIASAIFGWALWVSYSIYFLDEESDDSLGRSLPMLVPFLTIIFYCVQDNLNLALGAVGSLAFIRFRTKINKTEEILFIIASIAIAMACIFSKFMVAGGTVGLILVYGWLKIMGRLIGAR